VRQRSSDGQLSDRVLYYRVVYINAVDQTVDCQTIVQQYTLMKLLHTIV